MEFRNIVSPISIGEYRVISIKHVIDGRLFVINLEHGCDFSNARILFRKVLCTRYTPLKFFLSEYCERIGIFMQNNPELRKMYSGIVEIIDCDELKDKTTYAKAYGFKHYLIITEDEYVEVLAEFDPIIEVFCGDEKKDE